VVRAVSRLLQTAEHGEALSASAGFTDIQPILNFPRSKRSDDEIYEITAVLDQWDEPSVTYFKVQSIDGKTYLLRYDEQLDEWTLHSGFDGDELLTRPSIELVSLDTATVLEAEQQIESREHCHPDDAEIPFDWILAEVTGRRGPYEFILTEAARCPNCKYLIKEKRQVEPKLA
jgi:hypothetical protein